MRLVSVVLRHAEGISPRVLREMLRARDLRIDGRRTDRDEAVFEGQEIRAYLPKQVLRKQKPLPENELVYLDNYLCVISKPQGLPCEDSRGECGDTAVSRTRALLSAKGETGDLILCHRLDVKTGGLLMLAREEEAAEIVRSAFRTRTIDKEYECLVKGCPQKKRGYPYGIPQKRRRCGERQRNGQAEARSGSDSDAVPCRGIGKDFAPPRRSLNRTNAPDPRTSCAYRTSNPWRRPVWGSCAEPDGRRYGAAPLGRPSVPERPGGKTDLRKRSDV